MRYRIHRMRDSQREHFRWTAHVGGLALAKPRDYLPGEELEAETPYALWKTLAGDVNAIQPGDLLESIGNGQQPAQLQICKFIGFEPAQWLVSEPKTDANHGERPESPSEEI